MGLGQTACPEEGRHARKQLCGKGLCEEATILVLPPPTHLSGPLGSACGLKIKGDQNPRFKSQLCLGKHPERRSSHGKGMRLSARMLWVEGLLFFQEKSSSFTQPQDDHPPCRSLCIGCAWNSPILMNFPAPTWLPQQATPCLLCWDSSQGGLLKGRRCPALQCNLRAASQLHQC